jgi:hypothetical protein
MTYDPIDTSATDNAADGNVTTEDLVVNGVATGDFGGVGFEEIEAHDLVLNFE